MSLGPIVNLSIAHIRRPSNNFVNKPFFTDFEASSPSMKNRGYRNWAELPSELTSSILLRLSVFEILVVAQKVCRSWLRVCKDPSMWRKIYMLNNMKSYDFLEAMCRHAVDLSQGGLLEIHIEHFESSSLLAYIADRSSKLRRLGVVDENSNMGAGIIKSVVKFPLLEELELSYRSISEQHLKIVGQSCPNLRTLKLKCTGRTLSFSSDCDDGVALAIAETMPGLRHLQLFDDELSVIGLNAILNGCPHLQYLNLRRCNNINLVGDLEKRLSSLRSLQ